MNTRHLGLAVFATTGVASCGLTGLVSAFGRDQTPAPTPDQIAFFETKVRPVLAEKCYKCHGPAMQMAGLRLDSAEGLAKASVLTKGDPDKSRFVHVIRYTDGVKMPPDKKLPAAQIADLEAWVKMGAPWPKGTGAKPKEKGPLWSLKPVRKPAVPKVENAAWVANPIDAFVLARLEAKGQKPSPTADRRTLIRRVTYDLTGLPPTYAETQAFLTDRTPGAYAKVVDRLLASPRYGERWARHWLDVARYADTKGYVFGDDRNFPSAYTYRAWVIDALNRDLPYDKFVMEQLAADRMPETQGDDKEALAAMGFLTVGRRFLNDTPSIIDDRIDVTMRGFQGFTVACARCHDHKFDPIPTQDYYSLYAVFDSSEERTAPISDKAVRDPWEAYNVRVSGIEGAVRGLVADATKRLRTKVDAPQEAKDILKGIREGDLPAGEDLNRLALAFDPPDRERLVAMQKDLDGIKAKAPATPEFAMAMADRSDAHDGRVFKRGNPGNQGEEAPRRFLLALSEKGERERWTKGSGRLELAKAIASKDNPLTARVFVNRVWMNHFGAGIVRTPSDFGRQGELPTHPELLDYLASTFMEGGWSIKRLHKAIVTSATYRQSSEVTPAAFDADPDNRSLSRMNRHRLDLEQMRDSLMAATGRLELGKVGGKSVDLWSHPFAPRRAVYGFVERQNLPGIFRTFDFASPDSTSARRFQTTVPQQALFFLNSPLSVESAGALAMRPEIQKAADNGQRLRRLYMALFARLPDAEETAAGLAYLGEGPLGAPGSVWRYGYGGFQNGKVAFTPFATFADGNYRMKPKFPEEEFGYATLAAGGGHPGRDAAHAAVRRWIAPGPMTVRISGVLRHGQNAGDGVRARIVSSRKGLLGEWQVRHGETRAAVASVAVQKGDTLDFILDPIGGDDSDGFAWSPTISGPNVKWDASANFGPPPPPPLSRLTLYAQALMMTNEFMFVD